MPTSNQRQAHAPFANLYSELGNPSSLETQVLCGETVRVKAQYGEWIYVGVDLYDYYGYIHEDDLKSRMIMKAQHKVAVPQAIVYKDPTFKSEQVATLAMNSRIKITSKTNTPEGKMVRHHLGWIFADQVVGVQEFAPDFVDVAMQFLGLPYAWGWVCGRVDCSSLVMQSCIAAGIPCDRDVGPQSCNLGEEIHFFSYWDPHLVRGDLVFWTHGKGRHVVIMIDPVNCIHATIAEPYRRVVIQPLSDVIRDQERDGNGLPTMARRIPTYTAA